MKLFTCENEDMEDYYSVFNAVYLLPLLSALILGVIGVHHHEHLEWNLV